MVIIVVAYIIPHQGNFLNMEFQKKGTPTNLMEHQQAIGISIDPKKYAITGTITRMILGINAINMFSLRDTALCQKTVSLFEAVESVPGDFLPASLYRVSHATTVHLYSVAVALVSKT